MDLSQAQRRYKYQPDTKFLNQGISFPHHEKVQVTIWPLTALCIHLLLSPPGSSAPATLAFLRYIKPIPISRPLHWLFLLLGMLFPQTFACLPLSPLSLKLPVRPSWLHMKISSPNKSTPSALICFIFHLNACHHLTQYVVYLFVLIVSSNQDMCFLRTRGCGSVLIHWCVLRAQNSAWHIVDTL